MSRTAAVVITYNRKKLLFECLDGLLGQQATLDCIFIVNNGSTDGTAADLKEKGYLDNQKIVLLDIGFNSGSAGGFKRGVETAYAAGYDWIWIMDDDAEPEPGALAAFQPHMLGAVAALGGPVVTPRREVCIFHRGLWNYPTLLPKPQKPLPKSYYRGEAAPIDFISFVGLMINRQAIDEIGFPDEKYFIHGEDADYCFRLRSYGELRFVPGSVIIHKEGISSQQAVRRIFGKTFYRVVDPKNFWLQYYYHRNVPFLARKHNTSGVKFCLAFAVSLVKSLLQIILLDRGGRFSRLRVMATAYLDGWRGKFDRDVKGLL